MPTRCVEPPLPTSVSTPPKEPATFHILGLNLLFSAATECSANGYTLCFAWLIGWSPAWLRSLAVFGSLAYLVGLGWAAPFLIGLAVLQIAWFR